MSTLRINNIEAQSVPASPTIDEKVKVTNSSGDILVNIDGKTSGITTIGINTTDGNIKFDANSNVLITGILTATTLAGNFTPDSLEIGSNIKLGNAGVITATSFVGNLTGNVTGNISGGTVAGSTGTFSGAATLGNGSGLNWGDTSARIRGESGASGLLRFDTNGGERLRIDSSGRIGVGVVPTAQFAHNLIQIGHQATLGANAALSTTGQTFLTHNLYFDTGGTFRVFNTSNANEGAIFRLVDGQLLFSNSAATTGTPTVTERFRIESDGDFRLSGGDAATNYGWIRGWQSSTGDMIIGADQSATGTGASKSNLIFRSRGSEKMRITSAGSVLSSTSFVSKATADVNVTISTASGFTANTFVTVINHGVLEEESVYIISFKWNHGSSGQQPYFSHGAFVFNPSEVNTGSTGGQGPNYAPFQGHHMHTGVNRYWSFRYYGATGGTSVHGLQAAFDQTLNQSTGTLEIRATKIAKVTTI